MKKIVALILTLLVAFTLVGCNKEETITTTVDYVKANEWASAGSLIQKYTEEGKTLPEVEMILEFEDADGKEYTAYMKYLLFPDLAPITVNNFLELTKKNFYDGLTIHRIVDGTLMQGGDPTKAEEKRSTSLPIEGEFENNEFKNNLLHTRGVISMARLEGDNDSASSQFFVVYDHFSTADGKYAAFGVLNEYDKTLDERKIDKKEGILYDYDALEMIVNLDTNSETPVTRISIISAKVLD